MDIDLSDYTCCMKFKCGRCEDLPVWCPPLRRLPASCATIYIDRLEPPRYFRLFDVSDHCLRFRPFGALPLLFTRVEPPAISPCLTSLRHCVCCHCSTWRNSQHGIYYKLNDIG